MFKEKLYKFGGQYFSVEKILFENKTSHQELVIFENSFFGNILALDNIIQTTQKDEFIYHEMLTHIAMFSHKNPKNVLIIGGGDGGILREVIKHKNLQSVTMVEIDESVINMSKKYLPSHSFGAFESEKLNLVIDDGLKFLEKSSKNFDVIICDSTDPIGPGEALFTSPFYHEIYKKLAVDGIFVAQNGVAFMQEDEVLTTQKRLNQYFADPCFFSSAIPTYYGANMYFAYATKNPQAKKNQEKDIEKRYVNSNITTNYYNPKIHQASFAIPNFLEKKLTRAK